VARGLYRERAERATPRRIALSVGITNVLIGLLGGFPVCHGAGGMAAHHRLGGRTGGTTMILGAVLILIALGGSVLTRFIYLIPVPVLSSLLILTAWEMMKLTRDLKSFKDISTALLVTSISFFTRNLVLAVILGLLWERFLSRGVIGVFGAARNGRVK
jgi:MFS superfamily sulfate permease-like transporter